MDRPKRGETEIDRLEILSTIPGMDRTKPWSIWLWIVAPLPVLFSYFVAEGAWA